MYLGCNLSLKMETLLPTYRLFASLQSCYCYLSCLLKLCFSSNETFENVQIKLSSWSDTLKYVIKRLKRTIAGDEKKMQLIT